MNQRERSSQFTQISLFRHPPSVYDQTRQVLSADPRYKEFVSNYTQDVDRLRRAPRLLRVFIGPSKTTSKLARELAADERYKRWPEDLNSPVTDRDNGEQIGRLLRDEYLNDLQEGLGEFKLPDRLFFSDATRAHNMMNGIRREFPELVEHLRSKLWEIDSEGDWVWISDKPSLIKDARVRGKDYGDISQYPEERVYLALHTSQWRKYHRYGTYAETRYRPPNGENIVPDLFQRVEDWKKFIEREYPGENIWVITHSDVILAFQTLTEDIKSRKEQELEYSRLRNAEKPTHGSRTDFTIEKTDHGRQYIYHGRRSLLEI